MSKGIPYSHLSKRDYVALAAVLRQAKHKEDSGMYSTWWLANNLTAAFAVANPRFNRAEFLTASGYPCMTLRRARR